MYSNYICAKEWIWQGVGDAGIAVGSGPALKWPEGSKPDADPVKAPDQNLKFFFLAKYLLTRCNNKKEYPINVKKFKYLIINC